MRLRRSALKVFVFACAAMAASHAYAAGRSTSAKEDYNQEPLPPGFQVIATELEGPVFADAQGRTIYKWPKKALRNGDAGELQNKPTCDYEVHRENAGLMSPYPGGLEMPEVETRPACATAWPPVFAGDDAKPIGKWTVIARPDGRKQWAYDEWPLYTSFLDKRPGDVLGATALFHVAETGVERIPVMPKPKVPSQFLVVTTMTGRMITQRDGWSVYSYDRDGTNKSNCYNACLDGWTAVTAPAYARPIGEWTTFERAPGIHQWAFRGKPVYRYNTDAKIVGQDGSENPGWHNLYTQTAPAVPKGFVMKDTMVGVVLGDYRGMTIYRYACTDDALDQLACDYPEAPQAYRFAVCGSGKETEKCSQIFPYVIAPAGATSGNTVWSTLYIDPKTGKRAAANQPGALNVWAFRGRPVYTFAGVRGYGDKTTTDILAMAWGEFDGNRNGYRAMVYRDLFSRRDE